MMGLWRLLLVACAIAAAAPSAAVPGPKVEVVRDGDNWTAEYRLGAHSPAWAFIHSALADADRKPWRPRSWTVLTEGVRIERHGRYDVLVAARGDVPKTVRIRFTPSTLPLEAAYQPALRFSNGAVALFTDQFDVVRLGSAAAAEALPTDPDAVRPVGGLTKVSFRDRGGKVLHEGRRKPVATMQNGRSYVFFGPANLIEASDIWSIIDPELPAWLSSELLVSTPRLLAHYAKTLGPRHGPKPTLMVSWAGPTAGVTSMGGGTLPGLVMMAFDGQGVVAKSDSSRNYVRWFIAHEAAHFWLGQEVDYDSSSHAWMTEGGADLMAVRALAALDPSYDPRVRLDKAIAQCVALTKGKAVNSANLRSENDAYYACGAVFGLIAEAAASKQRPRSGFAGFWRELIAANQADRVISQTEWLKALTSTSGDPSLAEDIGRMTESGVTDPAQLIASLFRRAGVAYRSGDGGGIRLQ